MPCHCTGERAFAALRKGFSGQVVRIAAGSVVEFAAGGKFRLSGGRQPAAV